MDCKTCELVETRNSGNAPLWDSIIRTEHFDTLHAYNTSLPGWIVLVARKHIESISELDESASIELGEMIRKVSIELTRITGCTKTYVMQFAEAPGHSHVHFHIVPRMADMPDENKGTNVFNYLGVKDEFRVTEDKMNEIANELRNGILCT